MRAHQHKFIPLLRRRLPARRVGNPPPQKPKPPPLPPKRREAAPSPSSETVKRRQAIAAELQAKKPEENSLHAAIRQLHGIKKEGE